MSGGKSGNAGRCPLHRRGEKGGRDLAASLVGRKNFNDIPEGPEHGGEKGNSGLILYMT